jgi:hypothetical protein
MEPGQPAYPCSLTRLYITGYSIFVFHTENPLTWNGLFQIQSWANPLNKLSRLRVNTSYDKIFSGNIYNR